MESKDNKVKNEHKCENQINSKDDCECQSDSCCESKESEAKKNKKDYKEQITQLKLQIDKLNDKVLRSEAENQNFQKRIHKERIEERKYQAMHILNELLTPIDQLRIISNMDTPDQNLKNFLIGFKMISDQFLNVLVNEGVKKIDCVNKPFDPKYHHAIEKVHFDNKDDGTVVEEVQAGYMYKERVLRPSLVKVNEKLIKNKEKELNKEGEIKNEENK